VANQVATALKNAQLYDRTRELTDGKMMVTVGPATYPEDSEEGVQLVDLADRAMYVGKQQGGNRVSVHPGREMRTSKGT